MREIGVTVTSREPVRIPAHVEVHVHYQHAYECRQCSDQLDHSVIKKTPYHSRSLPIVLPHPASLLRR
ncbi:hypothetical protein V3472_05805 [Lacticaseibacillus rhamnosus]